MPKTRLLHRYSVSVVTLSALAIVLALGVVAAQWIPWGTKHARVADGNIRLSKSGDKVANFADTKGNTFAVYLGDLWWQSGTEQARGNPPCVQPGKTVKVQLGLLWVANPGGGEHEEIIWLRCK